HPRGRFVRFVRTAVFALLGAACADAIGPGGGPPYLAVVTFVDAPAEVTARGPYTFRVRELSGTLNIDTTFRATVRDTVIMHVPPASYRVDVSDVPSTCGVRGGVTQTATIPANANTSLLRFFITCTPSLTVAAYVDGYQPDSAFVLTVRAQGGVERVAMLAANDTLRLDGLVPGPYEVTLRHIAAECVVTSDGGERLDLSVPTSGGLFVPFRVVCADATRRPRIASVAASYWAGSLAYVLRVVDPDKDVERTFIDITACDRRSVLPAGVRMRGGFSRYPNVTGRDTAVIIGAYDLELSDQTLAGKCIAVWVGDERGNVSEIVETPIAHAVQAQRPTPVVMNAKLNGTAGILTTLTASDPDADIAGIFVTYLVRDGIVALPPDGVLDRVVASPPGIIGMTIPELRFGAGFGQWNDYLTVLVYVVDRAGNFTRVADSDLFN
ncbi:MAG TPA: hypothetical protein VJR92_09560, partial [Gemmatimonadaceae bacterium]|nr:hypothetical protein [Gemmatimonadaceae bacterium]